MAWCKFKDDAFIFGSRELTCMIPTKDDEDNIYRPKGNLTEFYENLKNKTECIINFDCKDKNLKISYPHYHPDYSFNHKTNVKFEIDNTIITVSYDVCFDEICEFLKQFKFVM